jgi:alkylhydroperoxidase family enzyme
MEQIMQPYPIHTTETAPEGSKQSLQGLQKAFGFIPNAAATMAESPALINAFVAAFGSFHSGAFSGAEKQVLLLSNAVNFSCAWTVAFHSTVALKEGVPASDVAAIREGRAPADRKYAALAEFSRTLIQAKGHDAGAAVSAFKAAGYQQAQVLDVIASVAISTMAATTANLADTPLEPMLQPQAWGR